MKLQLKSGDIAEGTAQEIAELLSRISASTARQTPPAPPTPNLIEPRRIKIRRAPLTDATKKLCAYIAKAGGKRVTGIDLAPVMGAKSPSGVGPMLRSVRYELDSRGINLDDVMRRDDPTPGVLATWTLSPTDRLINIVNEENQL